MQTSQTLPKVAVVGSGIAGIAAAYLLQRQYDVTIFEKNNYLGGHTNTVTIPSGPDAGLEVDTGFIVFNDRTYPLFIQFLNELGIASNKTDMSFSFHSLASGLCYAGSNLNGLFAQRLNLFNTAFLEMIWDFCKFNKAAKLALSRGELSTYSVAHFIEKLDLSPYFVHNYLIPMGAAIWSAPQNAIQDFPAEPFIRFFENHGLLDLRNRPQWRVVRGASHAYVKEFQRTFKGKIHLHTKIRKVQRSDSAVQIHFQDHDSLSFDHLVLATHADEALKLISDPSESEKNLLGTWNYFHNRTILHTDPHCLPPLKRAWAAWNYCEENLLGKTAPVSVTYLMNRLQNLPTQTPYCVTLNRTERIPDAHIIRAIDYTHPQFTPASLRSQSSIRELNGQRRTYFCGAYLGYGFHEDAFRSSVQVAEKLGVKWKQGA